MKAQKCQKALAVTVVSLALLSGQGLAQTPTGVAAAPQLTPAEEEVVKLAQAKVGDGTIIAYIKYSGKNYGLTADQILYLKQEGVSESVITAMLNPAAVPEMPMGPATTATVPVPSTPAPQVVQGGYGPYGQPEEPYVETAPPATYYYSYSEPYYYPYYGGYYYWPSPLVFSYGWGWGGWRGGWHGGAGGWHGNVGGWHGNVGGGWHSGGGFGGGHGGGFGGGGRR